MVIRNPGPRVRRNIAAALCAMVLCACQSTSMDGGTSKPPGRSLYDRLGGQPAIVAVVDDCVGNIAADGRINRFFRGTDIPRLKRLLVEQICEAAGGPCTYTGHDMKSAHAGMDITDAQFDALVDDVKRSLDKFNVPAGEQGELLTALASLRPQIVGQ